MGLENDSLLESRFIKVCKKKGKNNCYSLNSTKIWLSC